MVTSSDECTENDWIIPFKQVNFMVRKLDLCKAV